MPTTLTGDATLGMKITDNYAEQADRLRLVPSRLTRAIQDATRGNLRVMDEQVRRDIAGIAGGVFWDIHGSSRTTSDGATARVFTPRSRPHRIVPKNPGGVLHFFVNGREVFTREVNHPGSRPPDWLIRFKQSAPELLKANYRSSIERALQRI